MLALLEREQLENCPRKAVTRLKECQVKSRIRRQTRVAVTTTQISILKYSVNDQPHSAQVCNPRTPGRRQRKGSASDLLAESPA